MVDIRWAAPAPDTDRNAMPKGFFLLGLLLYPLAVLVLMIGGASYSIRWTNACALGFVTLFLSFVLLQSGVWGYQVSAETGATFPPPFLLSILLAYVFGLAATAVFLWVSRRPHR